jgi:hypothetical protein
VTRWREAKRAVGLEEEGQDRDLPEVPLTAKVGVQFHQI